MTMQSKQNKVSGKIKTENRIKTGLHSRNKHKARYDFQQLVQSAPDLAQFVSINKYHDESIDFSNPEAVKSLNRAILKSSYGIGSWDIPENYLCPPIPGRADYIHHAADLLGTSNKGLIPLGSSIRVLDIGVGANCIYPIVGNSEYGWSFLGVDIDPVALASASKIIQDNPKLIDAVQLRMQKTSGNILKGILEAGETFDISICNPPFHASLAEAQQGTQRKWKNLGKGISLPPSQSKKPILNFGGQNNELWCEGGEAAFIQKMIEESALFPNICLWFSTLVSREHNLPAIYRLLKNFAVMDNVTIDMAQGQKKSRIVAWTFFSKRQQEDWLNTKNLSPRP